MSTRGSQRLFHYDTYAATTSKILLVRLTAITNALLFQIRVTCFARYTV